MTSRDMWKPIEAMDRNISQFVLVTEDGAVRLQYWEDRRQRWEAPFGDSVNLLQFPTHWAECPEAP